MGMLDIMGERSPGLQKFSLSRSDWQSNQWPQLLYVDSGQNKSAPQLKSGVWPEFWLEGHTINTFVPLFSLYNFALLPPSLPSVPTRSCSDVTWLNTWCRFIQGRRWASGLYFLKSAYFQVYTVTHDHVPWCDLVISSEISCWQNITNHIGPNCDVLYIS